MCAPAAIAMGGLGVAQSAFGFIGQNQQANAQANYNNSMYTQTAANASTNYEQQTAVANTRMMQNAQATGQQVTANNLQAASAIGHASASAAGSGVAGNSVNELFSDLSRVDAMNNNVAATNLQNQNQQIGQDELSLQAQAKSRIAGAMPGPIQSPSIAGALMTGATSVFSAYNQNSQWNGSGPYNANGGANPNAGWMYRPLSLSSS